jgi:hypothetical protein
VIRWIRVVLPDIGWAALLALVYSIFAATEAYFSWQNGFKNPEFDKIETSYLFMCSAAYGAYRVGRFHPLVRKEYQYWLLSTPWLPQKPAPLGPVHIVPQDLVVLAILALLAWEARADGPAIAVIGFELGYLAMLGFVLFHLRQLWLVYFIVFAIGLMLRVTPNLLVSIAVGLVAYSVAIFRRFVGYPWTDQEHWSDALRKPREAYASDGAYVLGWPFGRLGPRFVSEDRIPRLDALMCALSAGWLLHVFVWWQRGVPGGNSLVMFLYMGLLAGVYTRLTTYLPGYLPPISLLGRLRTGRIIVPGYDQVFVAPLIAVIVPALMNAYRPAGIPDDIFHPAAVAAGLLALLGMGPDLKVWRLTGNHRISMGRRKLEQAG